MTSEQIEQEILDAKRALLELQSQKEELLRTRKLWFFEPNPKQYLFFQNAAIKRRAGYCGNRFGKSTLGVVEDCCWLIGYRPFFPEGHPLRTLGIPSHGVKGLVIAEDLDNVKEIFTNDDSLERRGKFFEYLPEGWYSTKKNEKGIIVQITVTSEVNGRDRESIIIFDTVKSYKNNPGSFESKDWDFIHLDEPVPRELWTAVSRGLIDRGGFAWWLLTPIKEPWMYNEMVDNAKAEPTLYWWFEATMDDNPTLSEEDKKLYLDQLPEDQKEARRRGTPLAHGRLVLGHYSEDYHMVEQAPAGWDRDAYKPPYESSLVAWAVDTHPQTPHAVLFVSINEDSSIDVYDELWQKGSLAELSLAIKVRLLGVRVGYGLCEPAAWNEDQASGFRYSDEFAKHELEVMPASKKKDLAIMKTQELFKQRTRLVRIHKRCIQLRKEIKNHHFDKDDKPEDKNDHLIECLRRIVIHDDLKYYPIYKSPEYTQITEDMIFSGLPVKDSGIFGNFSLTKF